MDDSERDAVRPLDFKKTLQLRSDPPSGAARARADTPNPKVADRVINIKVTTETFVDIPPPHMHSSSSSLHGHRRNGEQTRCGSGSGSGASFLAGADDHSDASESV